MSGTDDVERSPYTTPDHDHIALDQHRQVKAFDHPLRHRIIGRLGQAPATVSMLAEEFGRPAGTIGHHTKVLEDAGLVEVVRTRMVKGITERWLGRSAATFAFPDQVGQVRKGTWMLQQFARAQQHAADSGSDPNLLTVRIARIPEARAREWYDRLLELAVEFSSEEPGGEVTYTAVFGIAAGTGIRDE